MKILRTSLEFLRAVESRGSRIFPTCWGPLSRDARKGAPPQRGIAIASPDAPVFASKLPVLYLLAGGCMKTRKTAAREMNAYSSLAAHFHRCLHFPIFMGPSFANTPKKNNPNPVGWHAATTYCNPCHSYGVHSAETSDFIWTLSCSRVTHTRTWENQPRGGIVIVSPSRPLSTLRRKASSVRRNGFSDMEERFLKSERRFLTHGGTLPQVWRMASSVRRNGSSGMEESFLKSKERFLAHFSTFPRTPTT